LPRGLLGLVEGEAWLAVERLIDGLIAQGQVGKAAIRRLRPLPLLPLFQIGEFAGAETPRTLFEELSPTHRGELRTTQFIAVLDWIAATDLEKGREQKAA
jgi:hypothetical protein